MDISGQGVDNMDEKSLTEFRIDAISARRVEALME